MDNQQSVKNLQQQTLQQKKDNRYLTQQLQYVQQNQYIEQQAREKLGMVKNGEEVVIVPSPTITSIATPETSSTQNNWIKWWDLFF